MAAPVAGTSQLHLNLRVRVAGTSTRCKLEVPAACTLRKLKDVVAAQLGISDVNVSLNKKVFLIQDDALLTSLGICSGDLLWVHTSSHLAPPAGPSPVGPSSAGPSVSADEAVPMEATSQQSISAVRTIQAEQVPQVTSALQSSSRKRMKPPVPRAAPPLGPAQLEVALPSGGGTKLQRMWAAVHAVLLDSGLARVQGDTDEPQQYIGSGRLTYQLREADSSTASVRVSAMAGHLVVSGVASAPGATARTATAAWHPQQHGAPIGFSTSAKAAASEVVPRRDTAALPATCQSDAAACQSDAAVAAGVSGSSAAGLAAKDGDASALNDTVMAGDDSTSGRCAEREPQRVTLGDLVSNAREVALAVADGVGTLLVRDLCLAAGVVPPPSLLTLPAELQRQCFGFLQAEHLARLACCSREVRAVASSNDLWRLLFAAEFGEAYLAESVAGPRGWQALYAARHKQRSERQHNAQQRRRLLPQMHPGRTPPGFAPQPPPGFPGIIGGDMDRLPFLGGGGMPGLLGGARVPLGGARGPFGGGSTSGFYGAFRQH